MLPSHLVGQYVAARLLATFDLWVRWERGQVGILEFVLRRQRRPEIWEARNQGICRSGDLEIQKCGIQKIKKMKILKIQIQSAQNVGKVWITRKTSSWHHLGPSQAIFSMDQKIKKIDFVAYFPWWANGPYSPGLGPCCYPPKVGQ